MVVQWLGPHTSDAGGQGSIPYQLTEILHALWHEKGAGGEEKPLIPGLLCRILQVMFPFTFCNPTLEEKETET